MKILSLVRRPRRSHLFVALAVAAVVGLMLFRLGSLTGGMSQSELQTAATPVGWHGIYHGLFDLPLKAVRSVVYVVFPGHGQTLSRLPNTVFGALAIAAFYLLIRQWHGRRTALLTTLLFATGAWTLHVSRLASDDVLYLWALPTLLLGNVALHNKSKNAWIVFGSVVLWGILLYIPGLLWLIALNLYWQWDDLLDGWKALSKLWQKIALVGSGLIWWPLLIIQLTRPGSLVTWLGLPQHFANPLHLLEQLGLVFVHLFVRGPHNPNLWLGHAPLLDVFTLAMCLLGIYFYITHPGAFRSRFLGSFGLLGVVLIALGGSVGLSLLVPLLYMTAAAGIAYVLHDWLKVFPFNPLARALGISLIVVAVGLACLYNTRAYYEAWAHNPTTRATFRYHR